MSQIGKSLVVATLVVVLLIIGNNFYQNQKVKTSLPAQPTTQNQTSSINRPSQLTIATVNIHGFDCPTCPIGAEYALKDLRGVYDAKVTTSGELSRVLYDASTVTVEDFRKTLDPFTVEVISEEFTDNTKLN